MGGVGGRDAEAFRPFGPAYNTSQKAGQSFKNSLFFLDDLFRAHMPQQENNLYEFGRFRLDPQEHILERDGEVVPITPKAFDLLVVLVGNRGHVLSKDELMKQVWPDSFVEEANLSRYIFTLRKTLGEDNDGLKYIETIPRRGYRFVADVIETEDASNDLLVAQRTRSRIVIEEQHMDTAVSTEQANYLGTPTDKAAASRRRQKLSLALLAACLPVIALATGAYFWMTAKPKQQAAVLEVKSIAVLPLKTAGDNPGESDYLAEGISEALITKMSQLPNLRVIPWVTAGRYKESTNPLQTVAYEMGVDALITGSLRRSGDRIAVTISLIDGQSGLQYWAAEFEEPITDIFSVQRRIALGAARELRGKLSSQQEQVLAQSASRSAEAYEYYLRGKAALRKGDRGSKELNQQAFDLFQRALKIDPKLAEAYSGIGLVEHNQSLMGWGEKTLENAEASFQQALVLNPTLAEAHIGLIRASYLKGNCEDGLKYGQRTASLGLEDADTLSVRARAYYFAGIWDRAVSMYHRVIELDPANEDANVMIVPSYLFAGEYNKAIEAGEMFSRKFPDSARRVHYFTGLAYHCLGNFVFAKMHYELAIKLAPEDTSAHAALGFLLKQKGQPSEARRIWIQGLGILKRKVYESPQNPGLHGSLALFYGQLGNREALLKEEGWILRESADNGNSLANIADAFARLGETERAVEYYRRGLHMGFLTFSPSALHRVDGTEKLEQTPAYSEFLNELKQVTDRLREQY